MSRIFCFILISSILLACHPKTHPAADAVVAVLDAYLTDSVFLKTGNLSPYPGEIADKQVKACIAFQISLVADTGMTTIINNAFGFQATQLSISPQSILSACANKIQTGQLDTAANPYKPIKQYLGGIVLNGIYAVNGRPDEYCINIVVIGKPGAKSQKNILLLVKKETDRWRIIQEELVWIT
jgi:hypothetical protein